jgi:H+/Cl- antiporter ClcA
MKTRLLTFGRWLVLGALAGLLSGAASATFLWLLDRVTAFRIAHESIVFALPVAGLIIGLVLERFGQTIKAGTNLIIDTIHDDGPQVPLRVAPLVFLGTIATHLFGGSAGREGTAVQMGASLSDWLSHRLHLGSRMRRQILVAGVAGGFGSVFGTPIAGAVFGLEFVVVGRLEYRALVPAMVASIIGDQTTRALGILHTPYPASPQVLLTLDLFLKWFVFAATIALTAAAFLELTHFIKNHAEKLITRLPLRMAIGGAAVVGLWQLVNTSDCLGLGVPTIVRAFSDPALPWSVFALKLVFTALTIGFGFVGGEVTPLFFVGATLGSVLARTLGIPIELGAGVGLAAIFAAASNTPIALSIMAIELLGASVFPHVAIVCGLAYLFIGRRSLYSSQRRVFRKLGIQTQPSPGART